MKRLEVGGEEAEWQIPTAVQLCEFVRLLELFLGKNVDVRKPRVAVIVAAWDIMDEGLAQEGPMAYLGREFPLFADRLADVSAVEIEVFAVSVVGGDFRDETFKALFLDGRVDEFGYVITEPGAGPHTPDVTIPVRWVLEGKARR